jgi:hypothetical protein
MRNKNQRKTFLASFGCPSTGQYGHLNLLENVSFVIFNKHVCEYKTYLLPLLIFSSDSLAIT